MGMVDRIESTVEYGATHLSCGGRFFGKVESYNNFFTKFFAWLFRWSVYVVIGNKERAFDKCDYAKWLREHTTDSAITASKVHEFTNLGSFSHMLKPPGEETMCMNQCLSSYKTARLGHKLINALYSANFGKAETYILRGASLNQYFWTRSNYGISHYAQLEGIPSRPVELTIRRYTALLLAANHQQKKLCDLMKGLGADARAVGQEFHFTRHVVDYENRSRLETSVGYVVSRRNQVRPVVHLDQHHSTVVKLEDRKKHIADLLFNSASSTLTRREQQNPQVEVSSFEVPVSDFRYRIL